MFLANNPVQAKTNATTGAVSGPAAELARELARQRGLAVSIHGVPGVRAVIDAVRGDQAEIGFLAYDPERAVEVDFSQAYALAHNTYLVLDTSPLRTTAGIDRPGLRIGVGQGDAADLYLKRSLQQAQLRPNPGGSLDIALAQLKSGEIDAYAANRQRLSEFAARVAEVRLLPENFLAVRQAIIVAKGQAGRLAILNRFIDAARGSGFIAEAIGRAGLAGVDVAPPP